MRRTLVLAVLVVAASSFLQADEGRRVRQILVTPTNTLPIPGNSTLEDVVGSFSERYQIPIVIDTAAFRAKDMEDVAEHGIQLPNLMGVSLHTTLRLVAGQVGGAIVQIGGQVWIVPQELRVQRMMSQKIDLQYKNKTIGKVLEDLQKRTGAAIEVDHTLGVILDRKVTLDRKQVRLDQAIERLASLAKLEMVQIEDCLYITTPENAQIMRDLFEVGPPP